MRRVLVTGAAGFVGGHVARALATAGHEVVRVVRTPARPDEVAMDALLADPVRAGGSAPYDAVVHAAAVRHRHGVDAATYRASNVELIDRVVTALNGRFQRFVLVSSVGVYGFPKELPITEAHPFAPRTLYSATKVHAEHTARARAAERGFELSIVRPTIVYGPGDTNGMLDKMAAMIRARRYLLVGDGSNVLHHTYVDDVVAGILLAAFSPAAAGEDFILAGPETITLRGLSELVAETLGVRLPRFRVPLRIARGVATVADVAAYRGWAFSDREPPINHEKLDVMTVPIAFDPAKAMERIGYAPRVRYREGVPRALGLVARGGTS